VIFRPLFLDSSFFLSARSLHRPCNCLLSGSFPVLFSGFVKGKSLTSGAAGVPHLTSGVLIAPLRIPLASSSFVTVNRVSRDVFLLLPTSKFGCFSLQGSVWLAMLESTPGAGGISVANVSSVSVTAVTFLIAAGFGCVLGRNFGLARRHCV